MQRESHHKFWQRLHNLAKGKVFPVRVMFELTYRCNFYCPHCYVPLNFRKSKELKTEEIFYIIEQLADIGCFYLGFTGGEPFVRKDIIKIIGFARRKGFEVIVYTNGSLINKDLAKELSELRLNKVDITIPAMSQRAFERITKVAGSHNKVFNAIEFLKINGVPLGFKTCVLKENQDEIGDIQKFAHSQGALHRLDDMLSPRLDGSREPYRQRGRFVGAGLAPALPDRVVASHVLTDRAAVKAAPTLAAKEGGSHLSLFPCGVGGTQAAITPQGELKPCLMIDTPRYKILGQRLKVKGKGDGLKDAWKRLKGFISSIKPDEDYKCAVCELKPYCKWCPAKAWLYNKTFTSCESESKKRAQMLVR